MENIRLELENHVLWTEAAFEKLVSQLVNKTTGDEQRRRELKKQFCDRRSGHQKTICNSIAANHGAKAVNNATKLITQALTKQIQRILNPNPPKKEMNLRTPRNRQYPASGGGGQLSTLHTLPRGSTGRYPHT